MDPSLDQVFAGWFNSAAFAEKLLKCECDHFVNWVEIFFTRSDNVPYF